MTQHPNQLHQAILGSGGGGGGGGKGGGGGESGAESPNTLRSNARVRAVELLGEGPIVGLVDGAKSIYLDSTPLQNADGTFNFGGEINGGEQGATSGSGLSWEQRLGYPDQPHLNGHPMAETPSSVETRIRFSAPPIVRTISESNADSVKVVVRIPALARQDKENGNLEPSSVAFAIDLRPFGGAWVNKITVSIENQKCTSPYLSQHRIELTPGGFPWDLRVRRLTPDADVVELQNETWWESFTTVVEGKFIYPDSALMALTINAREFGSSVPSRTYDVKGLIIQVPTNYDPVTRAYTGIWNGSFKLAWTDNPAWIFYDLLTNTRYGLGDVVGPFGVDKWTLYTIARYCDQLVPSGYRNPITTVDIMEPRFTFNGVINSRDEAYKVLQDIAQAFRGMAYWSAGQVIAVADMPADPVKIVTPANVIKGQFQYSGTGLKARHSVVLVKWNDPQDFYRAAVEVVQNDDAIHRYGWNQTEVQAKGCTSRGQAHRYGKWLLDTEENENETVEYSCSWDQADLLPGQIISVADPRKAQVQLGGRLVDVDGNLVTLDRPFEPIFGSTYSLSAVLPDGTLQTIPITEFVTASQQGSTYRQIRVQSVFTETPLKGAMWAISGTDVNPRRYRVLSVIEDEKNIFRVTALFHDQTKFARVEQGVFFDPPVYTRPRRQIRPPVNLRAVESLYHKDGQAHSRITLSWTPSEDFMASSYMVSCQTPDGFVNIGTFNVTSCEIIDTRAGRYSFAVTAVSVGNVVSRPAELNFDAIGWSGLDGPFVSHLELFGRGTDTSFGGRDPKFTWRNNFPGVGEQIANERNGAGAGNVSPLYRDNVVRIYNPDTNDLLRLQVLGVQEFIYAYELNVEDNARFGRGPSRKFRIEISVRDTLGRESKPTKLVVENPVPGLVIPTVRPGLEQIFVDYPLSTDLDARGALVWISKSKSFDPITTPPVYDGINNFLSLKADKFETYYVRLAIYDAFGKTGLNISPPIEVIVDGFKIDVEPPEVPELPTLTASTQRTATGEIQTRLVAQWSASPSENFGRFEIELRPQNGNWIAHPTSGTRYEWFGLTMNAVYQARIKSISKNGYASGYSPITTITMPANTNAPASPTSLTAMASLRSVFLRWINSLDSDLAAVEIWSGTINDVAQAQRIGESLTDAFTHSGLATGVQRFYWVRSRNTSNLLSGFNQVLGVGVIPGQVAEGDIAANSIIAEHIRAQTITGDKFNVTTALPPTITIGSTGITMGAMATNSNDPAARINANTTIIDPGKILIAGSTTLANWRSGTDLTRINGGSIAANSIAANTLTVGLRGLDIAGLTFSFNKATNVVSWTAGTIIWINDQGVTTTTEITANAATWTTGTLHIAWMKGQTFLQFTTDINAVSGGDWVRFATYRGGVSLIANYGRTLVDGDQIITGTVRAQSLFAGELITEQAQIRSGLIQNVHLAGNITFDKMSGGTLSTSDLIRVGGDRFTLNAVNQVMRISDGNNITRALLGRLGAGITDYGLQLFDQNGALVFGVGGFAAAAIPGYALQSVDRSKVTGLGSLATQDRVADSQIDGLGSLATQDRVADSQIDGLGSFANISALTSANISTYIESAAISDAYIANLNGDKIVANSISAAKLSVGALSAITANLGTVTAGLIRSPDGKFVINLEAGSLTITT
jgi:predicted phage tail protein